MSAPINVRGEVIGELMVEPDSDEPLTEAHQSVLNAVADRIALAVENARLFTESQNNLSETRMLYTLSRSLSEAQTLSAVIDAVHSTAVSDAHRQPDLDVRRACRRKSRRAPSPR